MTDADLIYNACLRAERRLEATAADANSINPRPETDVFRKRMDVLSVGALVYEVSTTGMSDRDLDAVGWLEAETFEKVDFGEGADPWDEGAEGRPHPVEKVYYIRTLDGRRFRWHNARFRAAPLESARWLCRPPTKDGEQEHG